ncbi:MAG: VOC family protein [Burkholderiaceae bacterium]
MAEKTFDVQKLNHIAWRCRDAEETRAFYEDVLGLPLAHVVRADSVPSTGESCAFAHLFFRMRDGSFVAFFDLGDNKATAPDPATPGWVNHLSLEVGSLAELEQAKARLQANGVDVIGVVDHDWLHSIYFHDPNGLRLELAWRAQGQEVLDEFERKARGELEQWMAHKRSMAA